MSIKQLIPTREELLFEIEGLRARLTESEETLNAIRNGEVDAIIVSGQEGEKIFSLVSAETPYRILLEEMQEGAITVKSDGTILYCNKRFSSLISVSNEIIVGQKIQNFVLECDKVKFSRLINYGLKGNGNAIISFFNNDHKSQVHLKLSLKPLPSGTIGDICIVASDVTLLVQHQEKLELLVDKQNINLKSANEKVKKDLIELKATKENLQETGTRLSSVYNSMSEGLSLNEIVYDHSGEAVDYIISDLNPAFEKIIGLRRDNVIAHRATEAYSVNKAPFIDIYSEVESTGKNVTFETYFPPLKKYFSISVFTAGKGKFGTIFKDITDHKHSEELILRQNSLLESINLILEAALTAHNEKELGIACLLIAQKITRSKFGFIGKISKQGLEQIAVSHPGWDALTEKDVTGQRISDLTFRIHDICSRVIAEGKSLFTNDPSSHMYRIILPEDHPVLHSFLCVPLIKAGRIVGIFALGNRSEGYTQVDQDHMETLAPIVVEAFTRKQIDDALQNSEERLLIALDTVQLGTWDLNLITGDAINSLRHDQIYGYGEFQPVWSFEIACRHMLPEYKLKFLEAVERSKKTGVLDFKGKVVWPDGSIHWIAPHGIVHYNTEGHPVRMVGVVEDITDRENSEDALRRSEEQLRVTLASIGDAVLTVDTSGRVLFMNPVAVKLTGWELKDATGQPVRNIFRIINEITQLPSEDIVERVLSEGHIVSLANRTVLVTSDERQIPIEDSAAPIKDKDGKVTGVIIVFQDVTEKRRAQKALEESEERFRTIAESLPVMILIYGIKESDISYINEPFERAFGLSKGELKGRNIQDIFYYDSDRIKMISDLSESDELGSRELRVKRSDGTPFWVMTYIRKIIFMDEPSYLTSSIDITGTKEAQEELSRLNRTLDAHSKSSQAMMRSKDEFEYLNEVCKIIIDDCGHSLVWIGYAENDMRKSVKPVAYYGFDEGYINQLDITWDESERGSGPTGTAIRTGKPSLCRNMQTDSAFEPWKKAAISRGFASSVVLPLIFEGKTLGALTIYSKEPDPFSDHEIRLLSDLANDLAYGISYLKLEESERKSIRVIKENEVKLKELIATKDKFFNIVAHDLKNPFTSLIGSSELLYDNIYKLTPETIKNLALILNNSAKGGYSILQNLLDWSRSQTGLLKISHEEINIRELIAENISNQELFANNKDISIINKSKKDIYIIADRNMLNTVFRNILSNSIKFTHKSGKVVIDIKRETDSITILVKDNGVGISPDRIERLFSLDTRSSTPGTENEQGTGLGLKLSKEFIEKLGGVITVKSGLNKGSIFSIKLPLIRI